RSELIGASLVADNCGDDSRLSVGCRDCYTGNQRAGRVGYRAAECRVGRLCNSVRAKQARKQQCCRGQLLHDLLPPKTPNFGAKCITHTESELLEFCDLKLQTPIVLNSYPTACRLG